jgi:hypothetical protein
MKAHKIEHIQHTSYGSRPKISNSVLGIVAIFAIFLIVWAVFKDVNRGNQNVLSNSDNSGQASEASVQEALAEIQYTESQNTETCKVIVGQTTLYDENTFAASLKVGVSAYYAGNTISVEEINTNGCVVNINGDVEYLAVGQIQRVGTAYVTVREVVLS